MRTGPRSPTLLSGGESRTALPNAITVSSSIYSTLLLELKGLIFDVGKKLKRRLEDLEKRVESSSASPPQMHAEIQQPHRVNKTRWQDKRSPEYRQQQLSPNVLPSQYTPPMHSDDNTMFSHGYEGDRSRTAPLFAYYNTYPATEDVNSPAYPHSQLYRPVSSSGDLSRPELDHLAPIALPLMMQFHDPIERESPFNTSYQGLPEIDNHWQHGYDGANLPVSTKKL
jgi:hypothetical protein